MSKNNNMAGGLFAAKPTPLTIKETSLSAQVKSYLDNRGIYNDRLQCGRVETMSGNWVYLCKTGTPDRFAIMCGQIIFIEVKKHRASPTTIQLEKHHELRASGAIVIVVDSFNAFVYRFNAIRAQIEAHTQGRKEMNLYD
jgi:hypothetical protein